MRAWLRDGGSGLRLDQVHPAFFVCLWAPVRIWARGRRPVRGEEPVEMDPTKVRVDGARVPSERLEEGVFSDVGRRLILIYS